MSRTSSTANVQSDITPESALQAALVSWLALRDFVLWAFVQGVDEEDPLGVIDIEAVRPKIDQMNQLRETILHFAGQVAGKKGDAHSAIASAAAELLKANRPKIPLSIDSIPTSF